MINREQILATLKKLGPTSPTAIANSLGTEPGAVGYHLRNMLAAKTVKASGTSNNRLYALPEQDLAGASSAPPQERKPKKGKRRKGTAAATPRARAAAPVDTFLPAITLDHRLVLVQEGQPAQIFSPERTSAIADLVLDHFEV